MKCENLFEGKLCGAELNPSSRFCSNCGSKVKIKEEDNISEPCPRCSKLVTKRQRFCAGCGWKIDPSLFESKKIVCTGTNEDGTLCGEELSPDMKFCAACGTVQSKPEDGTELKPEGGQDKSDLKIGPVMNEQLTVPTNVTETAGSSSPSSQSDSPDTWKPPSTLSSTPESNEGESERQQEKAQDNIIQNEDRNSSGGKILILRPHQESITDSDEIVDPTSPNGQTSPAMVSPTSSIPSIITSSATAMVDSVQTSLFSKPSQNDQPLASTQDQTSDSPWPALAISVDSVNNNPVQVGTDTARMEKEHMSDKSSTRGSDTFSMVFGAGVIRQHDFTLSSNDLQPPRDGWTEQGQTQLPQQCTETNEMPGIHHSDVPSSNREPEGETSNVKKLTQRFESNNNGRSQGDNNSNPQLKREISQSSADDDEEEMSSGDEEEEGEDDDHNDNMETQMSEQDMKKSANKASKKKTGLSKTEIERIKKRERKERSKRRKLNLPENELEVPSKISSPVTRKKESTLTAKENQRSYKKDPKPEISDKTKDKKSEETDKQNKNTASGKASEENNQQTVDTKSTEQANDKTKDVKPEKEKQYNTRSTTAKGQTSQENKQQADDTKLSEQAKKGKAEGKDNPYNTRSTTAAGKTTQENQDNKSNQTDKTSSVPPSYSYIADTYLITLVFGKHHSTPMDINLLYNKPEVKNGNERRKEFAEVYFHVIVSSTMLPSIDKEKVIVRFHADTLGGWKSHKHRLTFQRIVTDGYYEYLGKVNIAKHLFGKAVYYVYSVIQSDGTRIDEHVYSRTSEKNNRSMFLGHNQIPDTIHRYDGVIREKPVREKGLFKTFKGLFSGDQYEKQLKSDASLAFQAFLPPMQFKINDAIGMVGEEIINHINWMSRGLSDMYQMVAGLWYSERDFYAAVMKLLENYISSNLKKLSENRQGKVTDEDRVLNLCAAVTLNHLKEYNGIQILKHETRKLCEAFLPQLDDKKQECVEFKNLRNHFTFTRKVVMESLLKMIKRLTKDGTDPCWMFCMPVLHYMLGKNKSYEPAPLNIKHNEDSAEWWGISEIKYELNYFQGKSSWDSTRQQVLASVSPYFALDYFLPRTFVASLSLTYLVNIDLSLIPPEVTLAAAYYYIRTYYVLTKETLKNLKKVFEVVSLQLKSCISDMNWTVEQSWLCFRICSDVLDQCNNRYTEKTVLYLMAAEPFFISIDWFVKSLQIRQAEGKMGDYENHWSYFHNRRDKLLIILKNEIYSGYEVDFLINWNAALTYRIPDGEIKESYVNILLESFQAVLKQRSSGSEVKLIEIYCDNLESFCDPMQEVLGKLAFEAVQKCSNLYFDTARQGAALMRFGTLLSMAFDRSMDLNQLNSKHKILKYTLRWAPFSTFLKLFYTKDYSKSLRVYSVDLMKNFVLVLHDAVKCLIDGTILVQDLKIIQEKSDHFKSVVSEIKDLPVKAELALEAVKLRSKEVKAYSTTLQTVQSFVYICTNCQGDTRILEEKIKEFEKIETISLKELCMHVVVDEVKDIELYQPIVTAFGLEQDVLEILPKILECSESVLFMTLWEKRGNEMAKQKGRKLNLEEILTELWEPTYKFWRSLCEKLRVGNLLFSEFEKFFPTANIENLKNELILLCQGGESTWVDKRIDQIQKYRNLRSCYFGANAIMEVVTEYELTGDFSQIIDIIELTKGADTKMNTLDDKLMNTCSILRNVDEEKANCLRMFITCKPLVEWLKQTMPNGLKDFKVFVELASISAGEGDYEIGRVNCLHSATTGYASLIFNLNPECNAKIFLEKCEEVWKELVSNPYLPTKLCDTNRHLEWLKIVKQSHGSVEVTSLAQAEAINTNGIYQVGNLQKAMNIKNPTLSDVMELRVTESEGQRLQRNQYKYEQLHDLQSRLMLVAGKAEKGKDDVDRFMLILDSIVRLGNIYTKLVAEGCVLFSQWHVKFLCDKARYACAFIKFGFGEEKHTLKGRTDDENKDVSAIIPKIAKFMEQCHRKWLDYIDSKREKYYLLNFFTVDQMVILQQELVKVGSNVEPSLLIYPLLSAVKHGCTKEDLVKAMAAAKSDVDNLDLLRDQNMEDDEEQTDMETENVEESVKINKFLEVLTKSYPVELAREALKHVSPDDIDDGLVWCMDNEEDFIPTEEESQAAFHIEQPEKEVTFTGWTENDQSLASFTASLVSQLGVETKDNSVDKLIKALEDLWETFLNSISSSVSDYLSVEHLGLILNRLAEQEQFKIDRTFLLSFQPGEPNLIICPQSEIYNTVLSVYSHESDKPLPQSDEVLMCTPYTTLDMVEIFWRRSLFADNNRVHCLVNADLLDYEVSDRGERTLERLMKNAESQEIKYKLVVICSSENEYKSRMVAALDKYHRPQLPIDVHNVQKYLLTKLQVERSNTGVRPASSVDFEKCSVRVVKSWRAGVGKSLYKKRMVADLYKLVPNIPRRMSSNVTIPLHEKTINIDDIMDILLEETLPPRCHEPRIFHIDISHEVQVGVDAFLFQLLILGCLGHSSGHVWRKSEMDYYIIESMPLLAKTTDVQGGKLKCLHHCLDILPHVMCRSPQESLEILNDSKKPQDYSDHDRLFDSIEFKSTTFQRPYQYLKRLDTNCRLDDVKPNIPEGDKKQCLFTLLRHCGIRDPSWSELHHFVSFLNKQLQDFEVSAFCGLAAVEDLPGFAKFVLRFLIQMSRDFSTRSLKVSEESPVQLLERQVMEDEEEEDEETDKVIQLYQMRRTWETSPHPYLFFNPDHHSMTFLGFNIDRRTGNLIDLQTREILENGIMQQNLFDALIRNKVNLSENFDALPRHEKIMKLCNVMGLDMAHDPDETYELTTDNVKKILAIYMRFRCEIPVIIMGETGCGKTRLVKFMCSLQQPPGVNVENMILMKVHGGTKPSDIVRKVRKAEEMARKNAAEYPFMDTVLFFDEANTTEAIGVIKEIMCDNSLGGKPIQLHEKLKIVAACNPYRKHSDELIKRLEQAGLGYHVDADKTTDRLGRVPMRRLVYRVQPLPQSMLPLVWDFGQLNTEVEEMYIKQMVLRYVKNEQLPDLQGLETVVSKILTVSQDFMRQQKDECSFVSLRDVERVLQVMSWFLKQSEEGANLLFQKMREDLDDSKAESEDESMDEEQPQLQMDDVTRSLVLALGVCYHACLKNRAEYRDTVARYFTPPLQLPGGPDQIDEEITRCQTVFLENVELADNIAKNQALKENVFMMIVCIELRIPMFLVGKPGSSKSLAKTIVSDAMQGNAAHKDLFKRYKQAQMVSFQCSPLSVPGGIVGTFRQCAAYQKDKNLDTFVSIVVLDEIGLAEDSPRMPLKTLHPLLEDGCPDDEDPEPYKKVAFIGISNWALDPAKMNRGILVQREVPDITELRESAEGICSTDKGVLKLIKPMIEPMAGSYLELFEEASTEMREFFGLRDFYSLLKMLYAFVSQSRSKPTWLQLKHSILRNFGGLENVDPVDIFYSKLSRLVNKHEQPNDDDPVCTSAGMIQTCLSWDESNSESRYLLLLTENYGALTILQQNLFTMHNAVVIFGSSFPSDQEYTQVCRNINRIKVCMETGSTVILLNLENLYESLYDALNQYYVKLGEERYVDLGLGTQRVKCRVHKKFRLIVVAEKQIVYNNFPIPLINRLEKHFLSLKTMLTLNQLQLTEKLQKWAQEFCEAKTPPYMRKKDSYRDLNDQVMKKLDQRLIELQKSNQDIRKIGDAFMGYHADTCAAIILHVCQEKRCDDEAIPQIEKEICHEAQTILLWCATPAAVWQLEDKQVFHTYFTEQHHDSLADYLHYKMMTEHQGNILAQITTNSKLLSTADLDILCHFIPVRRDNVTLLTLQSFDTEQQFSRQIKSCLEQSIDAHMLLIVQCDCGDQNADLIACARYTVQGELQQAQEDREFDIHVVFLIQLPGIAGGCFSGFQCGSWHSVHIDDLHPAREEIPSVAAMHGKSVSDLLSSTKGRSGVTMDIEEGLKGEEENMDTDEKVVDLMDIEIQEKGPDRIYEPKGQFHIDYLIRKCVQPALGNVKDPASDHSRAIDRLKIILKSLQNDTGDLTVLSGIGKHLTSILREKEQSSASVLTNWLSTEASKPENINRAGTFRRFAVQCLESRIIPLLAGIIAFIDTNRNLDILTSKEEWKVDLWLQIFNDPELTQLKYSLIVSPSRQQELQEIAVKFTSVDGKIFSAVTPFSWLIFGQIDEVLRNFLNNAKQDGDDDFTVVMKTADILQALPLGKLLSSIEGTSIHQILKSYIVDFVHMVHPVQSEAECNLVCESVMTGCKQLIRGEYGRLLPSFLGFHLTYIMYDARFKNFSHIVNVWPDCSTKTIEFQQEHSNFFLVTDEEMTLDILALHLLVDHLEPSKEGLNKPDTRMKWLRQVCDYRPIVERIFGHYYQDIENKEYRYGKNCERGIKQARYQWTRAIVVKLFIEHVCTAGKVEIYITRCMPLWQTLREGADMKDIKSLEKVEKFLKHCHKDIIAQCFGTQAKCVSCDSPIEGAPVRLPCDHIICRKCFNDCITLQEYKCPVCEEDFPKAMNPDNSQNVGEIKKYQDYRKRCNSFFMEVVSQLCFSDSTPPSTAVIEKLLSYIFCHTKTKRVERVVSRELTIFDDTIDPTPVVRSFLLQQLMQTSGHEIEHHLIEYFRRARQLVGAGQNNQWIELCQLVLQCMEDSHHQHANKDDEVSMATRMLREAASYMTGDIDVLERIDYISKARFSLTVVAKYIHNLYCKTQKSMPEPKIRKMFDAAARLCEECGSSWPRRFFVKQLCRCYGIDSYQTVVVKKEVSFLRWICLPELKENQVKECHDRYIVNGDEYKKLRETAVTTVLNENSEQLTQLLQKPKNEWQTRVRLLLALHREITMNIVYGGDPQKFTDKGKTFLKDFLMNCTLVRNKEFAQGILDNSVWRLEGNISPGMDLAQQNIYCLLTHYFVLMTEIPGKTTLLTSLQNIALQPQNMIRSFFPTMPQDEMSEIREALLAARAQNPNENPVFYRCPNGHPYIIGNCGRAAYVFTCKACGMEIGGVRHNLRPGNIQDAGVDRTETGHFIGRATKLSPITATERNLKRPTFAVLRLLTHLSMYIGANINLQAMCQSIKPNIEVEDLAVYLLEHIELDLTSIQNILGKNKDDVLVLIHYLLAQIMNEHTMAVIGENLPANVCGLLDKKARTKWEEDFSKRYIDPLLQESQNIIGHFNDRILNDHRLGADPLLQILYETDKPEEIHDMLALHEIPTVWRYRALISVDHLRQNIGSTNLKIPLLRLFLKEEHHLRAIRFVPSIMRLQKMLIQKYSRKLDRAEATALTIKKVKQQMSEERRLKEFELSLEDFTQAWNCVRESLETYVCPANENLVTVDKEYCRSDINEQTPISYLIPTHKDAGLCSYVLLFFLLQKQNLFLEKYCQECKKRESSLPKVPVKDISAAHLISYHPDKDLLPMVLANCNYSFEVGQGTRVEYNFASLERQLMDRFLFSKSIIREIQEIETITYRSESTNAVVFKSLYSRIKQERLAPAVQGQIYEELRLKSYPDLCESLDKLDIAISFLKSVGSDPESSLHRFMTNTLNLDNPFPSQMAQQISKCKNTMSLWITFALERARTLAKYEKKAFEGISDNFKKPLTDGQTAALRDILNKIPVEHIDMLSELMFECIVIKIDVPQNKDDEDYVDMSKISLHDALFGYLDTSPYDEELQFDDFLKMVISQLPSDVEDPLRILTGQSVEVWNLIHKIFTEKQRQRH